MMRLTFTHAGAASAFALAMKLSFASVVRADEIVIGQNGAGRLVVQFHADHAISLAPSIFPGIEGYATGEIGFHSADIDLAHEGLFMLDLGADIWAVHTSADPGVQILDALHVLPVGGAMHFGHPFFDYHPIFNITRGTPGMPLTLALVMRDDSGVYADSDELILTFTPASCPADFNADGSVDFFDYDDFAACFEELTCPAGSNADFNADGNVDFFDYDDFVLAFDLVC